MKTNLENPEHGFCPERTQLTFKNEWFVQIRPILRDTQGSLNTIFSVLLLRPSSKSELQSQIRLALVERMLEIYFMVDHIVMEDYICYLISPPSDYKRRTCIVYWERDDY